MKDLELKAYDRSKSRFAIGTEEDEEGKLLVSILWVPHLDYPDHEHIELDRGTAIKLRNWLDEYIDATITQD